ncbi:MAG: MinD/ParA family protein [Spirochaetaceae bacterium]|nr:MinD/ParA family protein [Spirochaetaceae bacterium]
MEDQAHELKKMMSEKNKEEHINILPQRKTKIIAITSGKGGVGKTNIATNLGIAYARMGKKVIVIDADLGLANVNVMMNIIPQYNLYHVIKRQKTMSEIIISTNYGVKLIAGASGFSKIANMNEDDRNAFIKEMYTLAEADIIIIDTSAGVSKNVISFLVAADEVIVVTTTEPTAITDAYGIIKIIATEVDNMDINLKLIVNRVNTSGDGKKIADRMVHIASQFLNLKIEYLGFIYQDSAVEQAVLKQVPFFEYAPKSKASACIRHIVYRLEKTGFTESGGLSGFLRKLFGRKQEF